MNTYIQVKCIDINPENIQYVRMYSRHILRTSEDNGFTVELTDENFHGTEFDWVDLTMKIIGNDAHELFSNDMLIQQKTSISVNIFPEVTDSGISIQECDIIIEFFRNKSVTDNSFVRHTDSCVKITHNPSGVMVSCQEHRNKYKNLAEAKTLLISKLTAMKINFC
jgi:peptide chain release factor 2